MQRPSVASVLRLGTMIRLLWHEMCNTLKDMMMVSSVLIACGVGVGVTVWVPMQIDHRLFPKPAGHVPDEGDAGRILGIYALFWGGLGYLGYLGYRIRQEQKKRWPAPNQR